jgi:hypothetical protein
VTYPNQQPAPRPGPPPGGFRPGPPPQSAPQPQAQPYRQEEDSSGGTGHPAVDAVLQSLANAATLAPHDQIAEYEAAHQVLQETLASIDR